jgi:hypothetical protein
MPSVQPTPIMKSTTSVNKTTKKTRGQHIKPAKSLQCTNLLLAAWHFTKLNKSTMTTWLSVTCTRRHSNLFNICIWPRAHIWIKSINRGRLADWHSKPNADAITQNRSCEATKFTWRTLACSLQPRINISPSHLQWERGGGIHTMSILSRNRKHKRGESTASRHQLNT